MSFPKRRIVLSPRARQDFADILRYTVERWGEDQMVVYRGMLDDALQLLGRNPDLGHGSADLPQSHRLYPVGSHVVVYRTQETAVAIVRILHQRMSVSHHI